jgi:hypothetical protein
MEGKTMMVTHWTRDRFGQVVIIKPGRSFPPREPQMMTYPFPLRGCIVRLVLPIDLTAAEAARLDRWVRTLAVDWEPEAETA